MGDLIRLLLHHYAQAAREHRRLTDCHLRGELSQDSYLEQAGPIIDNFLDPLQTTLERLGVLPGRF